MICPSHDELSLLLARALPAAEASALEDHLSLCATCRDEIARARAFGVLLEDRRAWPTPSMRVATPSSSECLSAREAIEALEPTSGPLALGSLGSRVLVHLEACAACRADLSAVTETLEESAHAPIDSAPEIVTRIAKLKKPASDPNEASDIFAPIVVRAAAPVAPKQEVAEPRKASARAKAGSSSASRAGRRVRRSRPVAQVTSLFFAFAAAAAAVLIAIAINSDHAPPESPIAVATPSVSGPLTPAPSVRVATPAPARSKTPAPTTSAEPESTPSAEPESSSAPSTSPAPTNAPEPGPSTIARGPEPAKPEASATPGPTPTTMRSRFDEPVADDGARIEVDLELASGSFTVQSADAGAKPLAAAKKKGSISLKPGDRLRASSAGAFLSIVPGAGRDMGEQGVAADVCLAPKSELIVRAARGGPVLGLVDGRVLCEVEHLAPSKRFEIQTPQGDFECRGTVFAVQADASRSVCAVEEGFVRARALEGVERTVEPGRAVSVTRQDGASEPLAADRDSAFGWARALRPERVVIYEANFDRGDPAGFTGALTSKGAFHGVGQSLLFEPITGNRYWGLRAHAPKGRIKSIRAAPDVRVQLSYFFEKETHALVQLWNDRQSKGFKRELGIVPAGQWQTATIPLFELETYYDPGANPVREGDLFTEIEVFAGDPGENFRALLDDVVVYRKIYR